MKTTIKEGINNVIKYLGSTVTVKSPSGINFTARAIIQPLLYKNKMYIELPSEELGRVDDGSYFMIGDTACMGAAADDYVTFKHETFCIQRTETIYLFDQPLYVWMTLRKANGGEV